MNGVWHEEIFKIKGQDAAIRTAFGAFVHPDFQVRVEANEYGTCVYIEERTPIPSPDLAQEITPKKAERKALRIRKAVAEFAEEARAHYT